MSDQKASCEPSAACSSVLRPRGKRGWVLARGRLDTRLVQSWFSLVEEFREMVHFAHVRTDRGRSGLIQPPIDSIERTKAKNLPGCGE